MENYWKFFYGDGVRTRFVLENIDSPRACNISRP